MNNENNELEKLTLLTHELVNKSKKRNTKVTFKKIKNYIVKKLRIHIYKYKNCFDNINHEDILPQLSNVNFSNKKIAIYTCISGNYDCVNEMIYYNPNVDYFLFVDKKLEINNSKWIIKEIPAKLNGMTNANKNRYIKMHPNEFFKNYDYSIYIDGNVIITCDILPLLECINEKTGIAIHNHSLRNCIYEEINAVICFGKGNKKKLLQQKKEYYNEGFPNNYGLYECNVLMTKIGGNSEMIYNFWWDEFIKSESNRDQIALPYIIWKNGFDFNDIGYLGNNVFNSPYFIVKGHN